MGSICGAGHCIWVRLDKPSYYLPKFKICALKKMLLCLMDSSSLLSGGIFLTPSVWMLRRCLWLRGTVMAPSSSETVKVRKGSSRFQVSYAKNVL